MKFLILIILITSNAVFAQKKKIAYCSNQTSSEFLQVFVMNEDGSDKKQLTNLKENCMKPRWSPDGKQITFYSDRGFVYLIRNVDSINLKYTFLVWNGYNPSFLPDGDQILFNTEYEDVLSIYVIDTAEAGAVPELISDGSYSNMQILSASGTKMVYSSFEEGTKAVMLADFNDTTEGYIKEISQNEDANLEPDISSDEKKIVYASFDNNLKGTVRIFEEGKERELSKGLPSSNVPKFSPDGSMIGFVVIGSNKVSLYVMNTDGSDRKDLSVDGGSLGTFQWMDNDRIVYDAGSEKELNIGIINVKTGENVIIADKGFNLQPASH